MICKARIGCVVEILEISLLLPEKHVKQGGCSRYSSDARQATLTYRSPTMHIVSISCPLTNESADGYAWKGQWVGKLPDCADQSLPWFGASKLGRQRLRSEYFQQPPCGSCASNTRNDFSKISDIEKPNSHLLYHPNLPFHSFLILRACVRTRNQILVFV